MEEQTSTTATTSAAPTLVNHAVKSGATIGVIGIILTLLFYVIDYTLLADWKIGILMILIFLGALIYVGIRYRNSVGGFLPYGKAFQHGFLTLVVAGFIGILFNIILYNVIDTSLPENLTEATIEKTEQMMQGFGAPEDKIEEAVEKMREDMPKNYSVGGQLKTFLWALLVYAVISAITSLFVKKNQPETF